MIWPKLKRKGFLTRSWCWDFFLGVLLFCPSACERKASSEDPLALPKPSPKAYNVLLISLDTLRADHLPLYGYDRNVSPRIDEFAKRSVWFRKAYSHAPWTTPAHGAMLTSLYPTMMGLKKYPETGCISDRVETMAEYFRSHGYRTHAVTEGGMVHAQFGFDQGFEYYFQSAKHVDHGVDKALQWFQGHKGERFFFFYHTYDIHRYDPPKEWFDLFYRPGSSSLNKDPELARKIQHYENQEFIGALGEEDLRYIIDLYDASIYWVDQHVGRLLDHLEQRGILKETLVIITSDHGEEFLERSRTGHGYTNFEEQIRVPMIFHHPEMSPGVRETLFRHIDLLPTLAEATGLPKRSEWLGESLFACLLGEDKQNGVRTRLSYCECGHSNLRSLQSSQWKLIHCYLPEKVTLFDLKNDPKEQESVLVRNLGLARQMKRQLLQIEKTNRMLRPGFVEEGEEPGELPEELLNQIRKLGYTK